MAQSLVMCLFSRNVRFVGATRIFARRDAARQCLAYAMSVEMDEALAMVLPLPVPPSPPEDAVEFVDLQGYPKLFEDVARAFPAIPHGFAAQSLSRGEPVARALVVHDVGDFVASFVPARKDFARLDARFRLDDGVFDRIPQYADWGFAVFQLKPSNTRQDVHPMAFSFPMREEGIFFPTVHVHHGRVETEARFDHTLYCQADGVLAATLGWSRSSDRLGAFVDASRARGLVDANAPAFQQAMYGSLPNEDTWLRAPEGLTSDDLHGSGECFDFALQTTWRARGRDRLVQVSRALREGLPALVAAKRASWRLAPMTPDMPAYFMNGDQLWSGSDYMNGRRTSSRGVRGFVTFSPFTKRVHPQTVRLGFDAIPEDDIVGEIRGALAEILDHA